MPHAPPRGDQRHAAQARKKFKDEREAQRRVLDADLDADGASIAPRQAKKSADRITAQQGQPILDKHGKPNLRHEVQKIIPIQCKDDDDKSDKENNGKNF